LLHLIYVTSHTSCSGLYPEEASEPATPSDHVLGYQLYSNGSEQKTGPLNETLNTAVSNYITNGAGVNVPSESLGFYFSGLTVSGGDQPLSPPQTAMVAAESFIQVKMPSTQQATWSSLPWPTGVKPRANAQVVWLPVSSQGVLVVIGGVIYPSELAYGASENGSQVNESKLTSPTFMTSLPVYDIGSQQWFIQNTSQNVPADWQLTEFCSVVAKATGSSSFEIFIYGGYDGLAGSALGDVWVLSIPSFTWVQVYPGTNSTLLRSSHACVKPYPDQMFVIGGESFGGSPNPPCFNQIIDVFNLSSLMWLGRYDPTVYADYTIPSVVAQSISATPTAIAMDPTLLTILGSKYEKSITTYYPYVPLGTVVPNPHPTSGPKWLPAVLGAVLGVVGLSIIVVAIWCFRRRKSRKSVTSGTQSGDDVHNWINGVAKTDASVTTTEVDDSRNSPLAGYYEAVGDSRYRHARPPAAGVVEVEAGVRGGLIYQHASPPQAGVVEVEAGATHRPAVPPRSVHAEADGTERHEMHVLERGSPEAPVEMATSYHSPHHSETSYHFRDHSLYPRDPAGASQTMSPSYGARSTTSHDASAPSPYVLPQRLVETEDAISHPAADSPPLSSPDQSPPQPSTIEHRPSHKRNTSSLSSGVPISPLETGSPDLDAIERVSGLGYSNSRPAHTRNMSSLSSGIAQLPSPAEPVPAEEDQRRSALLSDLPSPAPAPAPMQEDLVASESRPLVSHQSMLDSPSRNSRNVVSRKQIPGRSVGAFREEGLHSTVPRTL
jgi:hypothetical protein